MVAAQEELKALGKIIRVTYTHHSLSPAISLSHISSIRLLYHTP